MMVGSEFPGDDDRTLMSVQHSVYGEMVVRLFTSARDRYLAAASLLRHEDALSGRLRSMDGFDHRALQLAHDRIAAFFRFSDDGRQLHLGENETDCRRTLETTWREFVQSEAARLTHDDDFTRAVCTAAAFGNEDSGVAAERWIDQFLKDRYAERGLAFHAAIEAT